MIPQNDTLDEDRLSHRFFLAPKGPFWAKNGQTRFFGQKRASSLFFIYNAPTVYAISEKSLEPFSITFWLNGHTNILRSKLNCSVLKYCLNFSLNSFRTRLSVTYIHYFNRICKLVQNGQADSEIIWFFQNSDAESDQFWVQIRILKLYMIVHHIVPFSFTWIWIFVPNSQVYSKIIQKTQSCDLESSENDP